MMTTIRVDRLAAVPLKHGRLVGMELPICHFLPQWGNLLALMQDVRRRYSRISDTLSYPQCKQRIEVPFLPGRWNVVKLEFTDEKLSSSAFR